MSQLKACSFFRCRFHENWRIEAESIIFGENVEEQSPETQPGGPIFWKLWVARVEESMKFGEKTTARIHEICRKRGKKKQGSTRIENRFEFF